MKRYSLFNIQHSRHGFTLIELSLFMGLFSIVLLVLTTVFGELIQKQLEIQSTSAVESDKSYILSRLEYDIGRSDSRTIPATLGESSTELELRIDGNPYIYRLDGIVLEIDNNGEILRLNNVRTAISDLSFQSIGNIGGIPTINTQMTITSLAEEASKIRQATIDTTFGLR